MSQYPTWLFEVMAISDDTGVIGLIEQFLHDLEGGIHVEHYAKKTEQQHERFQRYIEAPPPVEEG